MGNDKPDLSNADWERIGLAGYRAEYPRSAIDEQIRRSWADYAVAIFDRKTCTGEGYRKGLPAMLAAHAAILASNPPRPSSPDLTERLAEALRSMVRACDDAPHIEPRCPWNEDSVPEDAQCICWQSSAIDASEALEVLAEVASHAPVAGMPPADTIHSQGHDPVLQPGDVNCRRCGCSIGAHVRPPADTGKPLLTEWVDGTIGARLCRRVIGDAGRAAVVEVFRDGAWYVRSGFGANLASGYEPTVAPAKLAADTAALRWYTLPVVPPHLMTEAAPGDPVEYTLIQGVFSALLEVHCGDPKEHASECPLCRAALALQAAAIRARPRHKDGSPCDKPSVEVCLMGAPPPADIEALKDAARSLLRVLDERDEWMRELWETEVDVLREMLRGSK